MCVYSRIDPLCLFDLDESCWLLVVGSCWCCVICA